MRGTVGVTVAAIMMTGLLAGCGSTAAPSAAAESPSLSPAATSTVQPTPASTPTPTPSPVSTPDTSGMATRIVIGPLKIDLPVVELPAPPGLPYCNVANRWWDEGVFVAPGLPGATYILAYPRPGMFLPLLQASQVNNGQALIGMKVEVYTSADWLFTYSITAVHRHVVATNSHVLDGPRAATGPELWLQTGESPTGSLILLVAATLVSASPASHAVAQPSPKVVACT